MYLPCDAHDNVSQGFSLKIIQLFSIILLFVVNCFLFIFLKVIVNCNLNSKCLGAQDYSTGLKSHSISISSTEFQVSTFMFLYLSGGALAGIS